ncbi:MAG: alpha/beta hydrolase [Acetobacteraceae bacterium]|nr:alpha/beta hydrolase [Acetobacteraceae bacterium]
MSRPPSSDGGGNHDLAGVDRRTERADRAPGDNEGRSVDQDVQALPRRRAGTLDRPGCRIYYEVTGSGPAIIFAHGLGGNHMSWWQQVAHFAPRYTCVTFAHRGFAPSSPLPHGPDPAQYGDDLAALVDHLGLTDLRIVAQSMGGWSAVEYALRRPPGLKAIVLAATTGSLDPKRLPEPFAASMREWSETAERIQAMLAARGIHPAAGLRMAHEQPGLHLLYRHIDEMNAALDKQALRQRLMAGRVRSPEELAGVACKVLLIANDEDSVIPPPAMDGIASAVPGARCVHILDAAHSAYFERPAVFNRIVEDFFLQLD